MAGLEPESRWIKSQNNWNRKVHGKWTGFLLDWNLCVWDNFSISSRTSLQQKWTAGEVLDVYSVSVFLVSGTSPAQWSQSVSATQAACLSQNFQPGPSLQQKPPPPQRSVLLPGIYRSPALGCTLTDRGGLQEKVQQTREDSRINFTKTEFEPSSLTAWMPSWIFYRSCFFSTSCQFRLHDSDYNDNPKICNALVMNRDLHNWMNKSL